VINPLHRPAPELPTSRPLPFAHEAPTVIRTETLPLRLTPPVTLPPPADETRVPDTVNGTVLVAWQFPAWGVNVTFQVPSEAPGLTIRARLAASAVSGAATATRAAATSIQRKARRRLKSVKRAIGRPEIIIFSCFLTVPPMASGNLSGNTVPRFIVANLTWLCDKRNFIARLIKGCRGDVRAGCFIRK
jgi:hypothetical protein